MSAARASTRQLRPAPTAEQRRAADPTRSAWVTASAGTGKTRLLADRVLRLLLAGTDPRQILCLTFTKAAAAEMLKRVQDDLAGFATLPEAELRADLETLLGRAPAAEEQGRARSLLVQVLDLPAGLPVMTIHGFCQSLLKRFPLEAGVVPHFEVIEPRTASDLLREAQDEVLASRQADLRAALARLAVLFGETLLADGLAALREDRLRLGALLQRQGGVETLIEHLYQALRLPAGTTLEDIRNEACEDSAIDRPGLSTACRALGEGSHGERLRAETILAWIGADLEGRICGLGDYEAVFLTAEKKKPRKTGLITKSTDAFPAAAQALLAEQARLAHLAERCKAAAIAERTAALLRVGAAVIDAYDRRKRRQSGLDYDDLIAQSLALLQRPGMGSWVQYKLDQQIDHLLVDEGQDTSPEQWAIVEALSAEFFSGQGAGPSGRTLFVVGDQKQSIMSFQGADLATFQTTHARLRARANGAGAPWLEVPLRRSFRSAPAILEAVDAVFLDPEARDGVADSDEPLRHESARSGAPGIVEVWPLIDVERTERTEAWQLPDRPETLARPERELAVLIARRIFGWLRDGTSLPSAARPIRPGDVMILLPRRGVLQDLLIRELKQLGVPVAGADRLALTDEIAVIDLMALGDALLLPEDDLTLAAVLKSPLFGLSEDEIYELAHERGHTGLHDRLFELRHRRASFGEAYERFGELLALVDFVPPFEFYTRLLGEGGGRRRMLARLGAAAVEPIEAFLAQALAFEQGHPPSMQAFLHWLRADSTELIRDPDRPRDEVRVLTCHGAKGLEAEIVFLADTTYVPTLKDPLLWLDDAGLPLWKVGGKHRDPVSEAAYERARRRLMQEHRRLLYVAMTRARDWLVVTGCQHKNGRGQTWHGLIGAGLERLGAERVTIEGPAGAESLGWRYASHPPMEPLQAALQLVSRKAELLRPAWLERPAPLEPAHDRPQRPSHLADLEEPPAVSPLLQEAHGLRRGRLIHRLLQSLPGRPREERETTLARYLAQPSLGLDEPLRAEIAAEVVAVLDAPDTAALFEAGSRAEVPIAGIIAGQTIAGQVDRLAVAGREVLVIDYKTGRAPPPGPDRVPHAYLRQMAAYRALLRKIYPERVVRCALLWTEGPRLVVLDEEVLERWAPGKA